MSIRGCLKCGREFAAAELLAGLKGYDPRTNSGVTSCAACGDVMELRVQPGKIEVGYTYWAGAMHFEGMATVPAPGLELVRDGALESCVFAGRSYALFSRQAPGGGARKKVG